MVTGQDLVEWQLRVASGEPLPLTQDEIAIDGWAMEARLYAENPATGFLPSTGTLEHFRLPENEIRVDSAVEEGGEVTPFYDPMIAKLIAHAETREEAAEALAEACASVEVWPVKTNAAFLARCAAHPDFVGGDVDTGFIEARLETLVSYEVSTAAQMAAVALLAEEAGYGPFRSGDDYQSPWTPDPDRLYGFRMNGPARAIHSLRLDGMAVVGSAVTTLTGDHRWKIEVGDAVAEATVGHRSIDVGGEQFGYSADGDDVLIFDSGLGLVVSQGPGSFAGGEGGESDGSILSPMPGKIVSVSVKAGDAVTRGQTLLVLEAMKMEHALAAPFDGVVAELSAEAGAQVSEGVVLVKLEAA